MEWEVGLIEWIQKALGSLNKTVGAALSFIGGELGLLLVLLIVLFCWKKESGKRLALIITAVNTWLPMIKAVVLRPRPYMEYPDRVQGVADFGDSASLDDIAAQGYSFPSTHSASAAGILIPLAKEVKKRWMLKRNV
jgi:membrane-associated phospholipid phosphatase